jgi:hypothetical protein
VALSQNPVQIQSQCPGGCELIGFLIGPMRWENGFDYRLRHCAPPLAWTVLHAESIAAMIAAGRSGAQPQLVKVQPDPGEGPAAAAIDKARQQLPFACFCRP